MKLLDTAGVATLWGKVKDHVKTLIDSQQFKTVNGTPIKGTGDIHIDLTRPLATSDVRGGAKIGYTTNSSNRNYAVQLSNEQMYVNVPWTDTNTTYSLATSTNDGLMNASDKAKLDGIDSGANNYKLPIASINSRGGIKTGYNNNDSSSWAVKVDNDANAYVTISGLYHDSNGAVSSLNVISPNASANYNPAAILFSSRDHGDYSCRFPTKDGTFALTSDCGLLVMYGGIVNNNISFNGYKQNVLISASGNYNISNWYNSSPVGSVIDIYPYGEINGAITADDKYIFQMMGTSSSGIPQIVTKKSINLSSDHYIRLIHISDGVYVCVSVLGY